MFNTLTVFFRLYNKLSGRDENAKQKSRIFFTENYQFVGIWGNCIIVTVQTHLIFFYSKKTFKRP